MYTRKKTINALFESYLTIRAAKTWGQTEFDPEKIDTNTKAHSKLDTCAEILAAVPFSDSYASAWINFIYLLADKEKAEALDAQNSRSLPVSFLPLGALFVNSETLLQKTMHAARSFALDQLKADNYTNAELEEEKKRLLEERNKLENELKISKTTANADIHDIEKKEKELQTAINKYTAIVEGASSKYHVQFFNEQIKKHDKREGLTEVNFDDLMKSVKEGKRKDEKCQLLLAARIKRIAQTAATTATATAMPTIATAPLPTLPIVNKTEEPTQAANNTRSKTKKAASPLAINSTFQSYDEPAKPRRKDATEASKQYRYS